MYQLFAYDKDSDTYKFIASANDIEDVEFIGKNLHRNFYLIDIDRNEEVDWLVIATDNDGIIEYIDEYGRWIKYEEGNNGN